MQQLYNLFPINDSRHLILYFFRSNMCYQRRKNAAYYLSLQHCLPHLTLSGKGKLYVATIEGILIVFLFKIISSFIFAYENYLVHVYSHACLCTSVHISTGCVLGGVGHSILGVILFRGSFYFVTPACKMISLKICSWADTVVPARKICYDGIPTNRVVESNIKVDWESTLQQDNKTTSSKLADNLL